MLGLAPHVPSAAGLAEGVAAYNERNDAVALREIAPLARAGNAEAEHVLGLMYYMGRGVRRDRAEAFRWHYKAALQGVPAAAYMVGAMYYTGNAVPKDPARALSWFRKASGQGYPDAQYALGLMYRYHAAGLDEDAVIAYMLWNLAAAGGHRHAGEHRSALERRMTEQQIAEAQCLSRNWRPGMPLPTRSRHGADT